MQRWRLRPGQLGCSFGSHQTACSSEANNRAGSGAQQQRTASATVSRSQAARSRSSAPGQGRKAGRMCRHVDIRQAGLQGTTQAGQVQARPRNQ